MTGSQDRLREDQGAFVQREGGVIDLKFFIDACQIDQDRDKAYII
jgi:hypothetical protein